MRTLSALYILLICMQSAFAESATVRCKQPEKNGLFNQCERIQLLSNSYGLARAYLFSSKAVQNFPMSEIFELRETKSSDSKIGDRVAISSDRYFKMCAVKAVQPLVFDCTASLIVDNTSKVRWYGLKTLGSLTSRQ